MGFKGGSSPGVLTGSWFVEDSAGESYVVVIGLVLFVIIAFPLGMLVGGSADKKINPEE